MKTTLFCGAYKILIFMILINSPLFSQNEDICKSRFDARLGVDIVSRYIFRGIDYSGSPATPHFQPSFGVSYNLGKGSSIEFGGWASYGFNSSFSENDLLITYSYKDDKLGKFSVTLNDFTFPHSGLDFTNFDGKGKGAHYLDLTISWVGPRTFPFTFTTASLVYNILPEDKTRYIEIGYMFSINDVKAKIHIGATQGKSVWNQVTADGYQFTNIGFDLKREIKVTDDYSLPVSISYFLNYHLKKTYLVFMVSI